ncbi:MAG: hypothetical protein DRP84_10425 [Spirochaetes bacterium]|nr:MAG: hypothetical protein DRP84_10425 [Spirochaetota bacterium]
MISIVQQRKHIEGFFLRFDLIDNLLLKAYDFCDKLIRCYYHKPVIGEYFEQVCFIRVLQEYEDSFVSALMPSMKSSIVEYRMLIELTNACEEFLEEYKQDNNKHKKISEYRETLRLKKSYTRVSNRGAKEIERTMRRIVKKEFPELVKSVYEYVICQIIPLDGMVQEFQNLISDLMDDIKKAQQRYDFKALQVLNSEFNIKVYRFLYEKKTEILKDLGYEEHDSYEEERKSKSFKKRVTGIE